MKIFNGISKVLALGLTMGVLILCSSAFGGEAVVIANSQIAEDALTASTLKSVFLGKKKKWSNGSKIVIVSLKRGETADVFLKAKVSKTSKQFLTYWKKMVFTGKGSMPKLFDNEEDLISYVKNTPGAVGFVTAGTDTQGVKTISVSP